MLAFEDNNKKALLEAGKANIVSDNHNPCDPVAAAVLINPEMAQYVEKYAFCDCVGEMTKGQTVIDWLGFAPFKNIKLPVAIDRDKFAELYLECAKSYNREEC